MVPNYIPPMEDELLFSYLSRLARCNGMPNINDLVMMFGGCEAINSKDYNLSKVFPHIGQLLDMDLAEIKKLFLQHDSFLFLAPFFPPYGHTDVLNAGFREYSKNCFLKKGKRFKMEPEKLKLCPVCKQEDEEQYGFHYLRKIHQVPGIQVCPQHEVPLQVYYGKFGNELDNEDLWGQGGHRIMNMDTEIRYAGFCRSLSESCLDVSANELRTSLLGELAWRGYSAKKNIKEFNNVADSKGLSCDFLCASPSETIFRQLNNRKLALDPRMVFVALDVMGLTMEELVFVSDFNEDKARTRCRQLGFDVVGMVYQYLPIAIKCRDCGFEFITNYQTIDSGWGCPACDMSRTDDQIIERMIEIAGSHNYHYVGTTRKGNSNKLILHHDSCGQEIEISLRAFVGYGQRCSCEYRVSEEEMIRRTETLGPYKLLRYSKTAENMLIQSIPCNHEVEITYGNLVKYKGKCPICSSGPARAAERMRRYVKDLTDGEYEMVRWIDHDHVQILHHGCGEVGTYRYDGFINGVRCHCENQPIATAQFIDYVKKRSRGRYELDPDISGKEKIFVNDTKTGRKLGPFKKRYILQELMRTTPSDTLPLENPADVTLVRNSSQDLMMKLREAFPCQMEFSLEDACALTDASYSAVAHKLSNLYKKGQLDKKGKNRYIVTNVQRET